MKAIILCAGNSTRTHPLTVTQPKPLLRHLNHTILDHNLNALPKQVTQVILVVGFLQEKIRKHIATFHPHLNVAFVTQSQRLGTAHALSLCQKLLAKQDYFLFLNGDDLYSAIDLHALAAQPTPALLVTSVPDPQNFGVVLQKHQKLIKIIEKPADPPSNLVNIGAYLLSPDIFNLLPSTYDNEVYLAPLLTDLSNHSPMSVVPLKGYWLPTVYPWSHLDNALYLLQNNNNWSINGTIEPNVTINGRLHLGHGSVIKSGSYIEGDVWISDYSTIGPHAFLRHGTIIHDHCIVRAEVVSSIIGSHSLAKHQSYLGYSVIGESVNIAAGTITADLRHDHQDHITLVNGNKVNTKRKKLGAFIGDHASTGIGTLILPGRKLWPNTTTSPGQIVSTDIKPTNP